jgi:hypothetical protein
MEQEKLAQRADTDQRLSGDGAPSLSNTVNVDGHKLVGPQEGFGPLWRKKYHVRLHGAAAARPPTGAAQRGPVAPHPRPHHRRRRRSSECP